MQYAKHKTGAPDFSLILIGSFVFVHNMFKQAGGIGA